MKAAWTFPSLCEEILRKLYPPTKSSENAWNCVTFETETKTYCSQQMTNQNALIMCINVSIFEQKLAFLNNILSSTNNAEPKKKKQKKKTV